MSAQLWSVVKLCLSHMHFGPEMDTKFKIAELGLVRMDGEINWVSVWVCWVIDISGLRRSKNVKLAHRLASSTRMMCALRFVSKFAKKT